MAQVASPSRSHTWPRLRCRSASDRADETENELLRLLSAKDYRAFMRLAVTSRKNILVSGPTGSAMRSAG